MKRRTFWVLAAGVALVAIGAAAVGLLALALRGASGGPGVWGGRAYLDLTLDGLPERPPAELGLPFERQPPSLRTFVESLDRAAADPGLTAVVVRVGNLGDAGWARVQELRDALLRFRRSGKPAYAFLEGAGNGEYYLASACDKIYAVPTAIVAVTGLAAEVTFFRATLDKLGVEAQFEGFGKYKNAPNQYTETGFTAPHREQTEALLDSLDRQFVEALARGRKRTPEQVREWIDAGPYDARDAQRVGLVDELLYRDELETRLEGAGRVTAAGYARGGGGFGFGRPRIALIYALGEILPGRSSTSPFGGESAGSDTLAAALRQAREDGSVRAVVLRVDSPGGSGAASDVIWREMRETRRRKPVIVSMGDVAASGGYYIAMAGDVIVAEPGTITGSIGVFGGKFTLRGLYDKLGISKEIVTRGKSAALFSDYRPWDDEERARIRAMMESFYRDFVGRVAEHRGKTYDEADALAQGRVWSGAEARQHGLVDRLGGLETAIGVAKEKAGIAPAQDVALVVLPARKGLFDMLFERQEDAEIAAARALPAEARALLRWAAGTSAGPIARLPFDLRVR
jgi:protease-4